MNFKRGGRVTSERLNTSHTIYFLLVLTGKFHCRCRRCSQKGRRTLSLGNSMEKVSQKYFPFIYYVSYVLKHGDSFQHNLVTGGENMIGRSHTQGLVSVVFRRRMRERISKSLIKAGAYFEVGNQISLFRLLCRCFENCGYLASSSLLHYISLRSGCEIYTLQLES